MPRGKRGRTQEVIEEELLQEELLFRLETSKHHLESILANPALYQEEDNQFVRNFVETVNTHPEDYTPQPDAQLEEQGDQDPSLHEMLTRGFISSIVDQTYVNDGSIDPIVQVVSEDSNYIPDLSGQQVKIRSLKACDGDGNRFLVKISTHLTEAAYYLKPGDVLQMSLFNLFTFRPQPDHALVPSVLLLKYRVLGNDPHIVDGPAPLSSPVASSLPGRNLQNASVPREDEIEPVPPMVQVCEEGHRLCSLHGVECGQTCIVEATPVRSLVLDAIVENCYFVTKSVGDMSNREKRNVLCWHCSTNIYGVLGKGERKEHPECLVFAIRTEYPNPKNVPYTGFSPGNAE